LGGHVDTYYDFPSIEGYDPLYIQRYGEFISSADKGSFTPAGRSVVLINRNAQNIDRVFDLLGVTLIFHPITDTYQGWAYNVWSKPDKYTEVFKDVKYQVFKNNSALGRADLFYNFEIIQKKEDIIKRIYSKDFNFRNDLILEEQPEIEKDRDILYGKTNIVSYTPDKVVIQVDSSKPALLFLSDNYYPGWRAKVNGVSEKIYRADYSFRAVVVPAGKSTVEFFYGGLF
jgi:hypothetical protein